MFLPKFQSNASCRAVEQRAKEIAQSLDAEYWSVSAKTGMLKIGLHFKIFGIGN